MLTKRPDTHVTDDSIQAARAAVEHGWAAYNARDWIGAAVRFERVRAWFPDDPSGYVGLGAALREQGRPADADAVLAAGIARFPERVDLLINYAWSGHRAADWDEALRRWKAVTESHPDDPSGYAGTAVTARSAARPDLEDAVLLAAREHFPTQVQFAELYANAAMSRADRPEAVRRWRSACHDFPTHEACHVGLARALLASARADEAETVLSQAVERFPRNLELATVYARLAGDRQDRALERWETVRARFPDIPAGYVGAAQILRSARRFEEAEAALVLATARFPDSFEAALEHARVAKSQGDWPEASRRLRAMRTRFPNHPAIFAGMGEVLREQGKLDEADAVLGEAVGQFPEDRAILFGHAQIAAAKEDWDEAVSRWQAVRKKFSNDIDVRIRLGDAIQMAALASASDNNRTGANRHVVRAAGSEEAAKEQTSKFFLEFESLGDNCEFGMVQRHFGAEPLGLLRFAGITPAMLARGLRDGFSGMWEPENVVLSLEGDEYFVDDKKYRTRMHTFIRRDSTDAARFHSQMCKRLRFLAQKLDGDLRLGDKIFVYKVRDGVISDDAMWEIFDAIRLLGKSPFLCVRSGADNTKGETRLLAPGFVVGHISKLSSTAFHEDIRYDEWERICRGAYRLLRSGGEERPDTHATDDTIQAARAAVEHGWAAYNAGDWVGAAVRFERVRAWFPDDPNGYVGLGAALREQGRPADADAVLAAGIARFPERVDLLINYAWSGHRAADWDEALRRWKAVTESHPDDPSGYAGTAVTARSAARPDLEDAVLLAARERFPGQVQFAELYANAAVSRADRTEAVRRWRSACDDFPTHETCHVGLARALLASARADEAGTVLSQAAERSPDPPASYIGAAQILRLTRRFEEAEAALEYAWVAKSQRDWPEALRRLRAIRARFPDHPAVYAGIGEVLREQGKLDEADAVLGEATEQFPDDRTIAIEHALVANGKRDWDTAAARWRRLSLKFPDDQRVLEGLGQARWGVQLDAEVPPAEKPRVDPPGPALMSDSRSDNDLAALFMQFESLGDNCEFGLLQRHFGAEPLGLLRWTGTAPSGVITALTHRFEGVGEPENTILEPIRGEYLTRDRRYGMVMHTFVSEGQIDQTRLYAQQCKRLKFLRNKLIDDLMSGEKIFVCRSVDELTDPVVMRLFKAVRMYGNSRVLCVRPCGQDRLPGTVQLVEPGLFVGYIDRLGPQRGPTGDSWDISFGLWQQICRRVLELKGQ